ncbi:helix-turn-helix domain-containing protein [Roseomonas sp. CAU 1739]|uniref:helix-turn-helix domain-containing protein n=1 Tax=Roseomonas sp. CAU 1739 TaxID=3140364 RepID=UPI00325ACC13
MVRQRGGAPGTGRADDCAARRAGGEADAMASGTHIDPLHEGSVATLQRGVGAVPRDVARAVTHMRVNMAHAITAAELARAAGVPERTLQKHFLAFLGIPPLAYLRQLRLAAVREALIHPAEGVTITDVATACGFAHLGRFASEYRRRFGEPPSATLERGRAAVPTRSAGPGGFAVARKAATLVVMPLSVVDGARLEARAVAEAISAQLAAQLSRVPGLAVSLAQPGRGRECGGARYGLGGLVVRAGDRLRVLLRLLDRSDGTHLWGDAFDGEGGDPFDLQDRAVGAALEAIGPHIEGAEIALAQRKDPGDLEARDLILRAMPLVLAADPDSAEQALRWLREAMEMDPADATAPALAAWSHAQRVSYFRATDRAGELSLARTLASRAIMLDPGSSTAFVAASGVALAYSDGEQAHALMARALAIDPRSSWGWERLGWLDCFTDAPAASLGDFARAIRLKPRGLPLANCLAGIGYAHFKQGHYPEAAMSMRKALALNPRAMWLNRILAPCYLMLGEHMAARRALQELRESCPAITLTLVVAALPRGIPSHGMVIADGLSRLGLPP